MSMQSAPDRTGCMAAACSGRRSAHPSELTTWYSMASSRPVPPDTSLEAEVDVVDRGRCAQVPPGLRLALDIAQLGHVHGELVVPARVEVRELVHAVKDVGDKLLEVDTGRHSGSA